MNLPQVYMIITTLIRYGQFIIKPTHKNLKKCK